MLTRMVTNLERTRDSLTTALAEYWPATGLNEMAEANIVVHLAAALRDDGCNVFAEVPLAGPESRRIDLFAFDSRLAVVAEAKRLYNHEQAAKMANDYWDIEGGYLSCDPGVPTPELGAPVVCILATSWQDGMCQWWSKRGDASPPGRGNGWSALAAALQDATDVGALDIQTTPPWGTQKLLYALKQRSTSFIAGQPTRG